MGKEPLAGDVGEGVGERGNAPLEVLKVLEFLKFRPSSFAYCSTRRAT